MKEEKVARKFLRKEDEEKRTCKKDMILKDIQETYRYLKMLL